MKKTTEDREHELLDAIVKTQRARGYAPTRRELAAQLGISTTRAQQLVVSCTAKGYLSTAPRAARAFVVHEANPQSRKG